MPTTDFLAATPPIAMYLIAAHLAGDFLLQNDWMAARKQHSSLVCTVHVGVYMLGFVALAVLGLLAWAACALIAAQHWIQDRTSGAAVYMHLMGQKEFAARLGPWSVIVVDQSLHLVWIALVLFVERGGPLHYLLEWGF
jgi:hypothetical protein